MRILCKVTGREAKPTKGPTDPAPVFKCFPKGRASNEDIHSVKFDRIEDAAIYLINNRGAGIRVPSVGTGTGEKTAILNSQLVIELD